MRITLDENDRAHLTGLKAVDRCGETRIRSSRSAKALRHQRARRGAGRHRGPRSQGGDRRGRDRHRSGVGEIISPQLKAGKTVLIAAHGNSLRAIVKMLDNLSEEEIAKVNIPTAMPLLYELDENFKPIKPRGEYLDPEAAAAGAAAVAAQGQK